MAREGRLSGTLGINQPVAGSSSKKINFTRSGNNIFDVAASKGPSPGLVVATPDGTDVDLSLITATTSPGACWIKNLSSTEFITVGRWDPSNTRFYPLLEFAPLMEYPIYLSRDVGEEYEGTGTGTAATVTRLRIKAGGEINVDVEVAAYGR